MKLYPKRGEIWWVSLDPTKGSEINKTRPCLILSRDDYNRSARTVTIVPISSGESRYPNWAVELDKSCGLKNSSHVVLPQLRVAAKERLRRRIGKTSVQVIQEIEEKLLFYLGFDHLLKHEYAIIDLTSN